MRYLKTSPRRSNVKRVLSEPLHATLDGLTSGESVITDGKFMIRSEHAPENLVKHDKRLKDNGKTGMRDNGKDRPKNVGYVLKELKEESLVPLELVAFQKDTEIDSAFHYTPIGNPRDTRPDRNSNKCRIFAILSDDKGRTVIIDEKYYTFFSKTGIGFSGTEESLTRWKNRGSIALTRNDSRRKWFAIVGAVMPIEGRTESRKKIEDSLRESDPVDSYMKYQNHS